MRINRAQETGVVAGFLTPGHLFEIQTHIGHKLRFYAVQIIPPEIRENSQPQRHLQSNCIKKNEKPFLYENLIKYFFIGE